MLLFSAIFMRIKTLSCKNMFVIFVSDKLATSNDKYIYSFL